MAIETTEFASVSISVSPTGIASGNFGVLGFLTNELGVIGAAERSRLYKSLAGLANDWNINSEVYKAAEAFYGQTPTPTDFVVLMCYESDQPALLTGGLHDTLTELTGITTGSLTITTDHGEAAITNLDLSSATSLASVANLLETAINAITTGAVIVGYDQNAHVFEVSSTTNGASSSISFGTGDAADALGLSQHQAQITNGFAAETPVQALSAVIASGRQFTGLVTHKKYRDILTGDVGTTTLEIAQWATAAKKIFCNTSNDLSVLNASQTLDIISQCKGITSRFVLSTFSKYVSQYPSAAVFGRAASVNFSGIDTTITLNLKQLSGVSAENLTPSQFAVLRSKYGSAIVEIGLAGSSVNAYTDSRMSSGSWLDTTHGLLWLENRCEVDMFNLLYQTATKIKYTQAGINTTAATLTRSLQAAVRNGLSAPGYTNDGTYLSEGFVVTSVKLADVPSSDKGNRTYKGLGFIMVGAGALQDLTVSGTFIE